MPTRKDYECKNCGHITEVVRRMIDISPISCPSCQSNMVAYFGRMEPLINYGFRSHRYSNPTDRDIAQFQFKNL